MQENYIFKLCLNAENIVVNDVSKFFCIPTNLERIYSNIYCPEYRSGIRYEDVTFMKKYTEKEALKLLTKRLELSQKPFFLDLYQTGENGESIAIARTGRYIFLYMLMSYVNYEKNKEELQNFCEGLLAEKKLLFAYCSNLLKKQIKGSPWRRLIYARHNKVKYNFNEENIFLKRENLLSIEYQYIDVENLVVWKNDEFVVE